MHEQTEQSIILSANPAGGISTIPPARVSSRPSSAQGRNLGDVVFKNSTLVFAIVVFSLVFLMILEMVKGSQQSIAKFGWSFLWTTTWDPVHDVFGALPFIYGTLVTSFIALALALPLGLGVAIFLSEIAPRWIAEPCSFLVELLAAIPSIVYGLWGVFVMVPWMRLHGLPLLSKSLGTFIPLFRGLPYGFGMLTAGVILAIMILPIITAITRDVLRSIPTTQREAALAIGATPWETTRIILGSARSGIVGATLLGLGRAIGETMAVTMVIGNRPEISTFLFNPGYSMASVIANEFTEATSDLYTSSLIEIALLLFVVTILLNALARLVVWSVSKKFRMA